MDVTLLLLGIAGILFFGFLAEFLFRKTGVPDVLFLILLGFLIGPYVLGWVTPERAAPFAPAFTTFALLFLLYEGAFNMDLASFAKGLTKGVGLTLFNFVTSVIVVTAVMLLFGQPLLVALLMGFVLGGISSAFVLPLLKQIGTKGQTYSVLTLESAFTDVLCIVGALTTLEIITVNAFDPQLVVGKIAALFAVAIGVGILAGVVWILVTTRFAPKSYLLTVAYLLLVYVAAELLGGKGEIAALFFGLILKNSKQLTKLARLVAHNDKNATGVRVTSSDEEFFYKEISFLLKTFFFVYVGVLISFADWRAVLIGAILAAALLGTRMLSFLVTRSFDPKSRTLIAAISARGLAAAAIAQLVVQSGIVSAAFLSGVTYAAITLTLLFSSIRVFLVRRQAR